MFINSCVKRSWLLLGLISSLHGAGNIIIEGRVNTVGVITWPNINDGDENPNQTATQFGLTDTNYFTDRTFRIRNTDNNETLTVFVNANSPTSSSSQFSFPDFPSSNFTIAPNQNREFRIRYRPVQGGGRTTTITIRSNSGNTGSAERTYTFAVTGDSREGEIALAYNPSQGNDVGIGDGASASVTRGTDFGSLRVSASARQRDFYVRNSSSAPDRLRYSDAEIIGSGASHFRLRGLGDGTLGVGNNDNFTIEFNPTSAGVKTATFRLQNSDTDEDPFTFALRGEGTAFPEIRVQGRREQFGTTFTEISDNDSQAESADGTRFDNTTVGQSRDSIFRVHNDGDATLILSQHTINGMGAEAFQLLGTDASVPAGESRDFEVRFTPPEFGTFNAEVSFTTNDSNENPFNFAIRGSGIAPEIAVAGRRLSSDPYDNIEDGGTNSPALSNGTDFGQQNVSSGRAQKNFRISNSGNVTLNITDRRFIGDSAGEFSVSNLLSLGNRAIAPGENHVFTISFDPSSAGTKNVIFEMGTDDPDEDPFTFNLRGEGIGFPEIRVQGRRRVVAATLSEIMNGDDSPRPQDGTEFNDTEVGETFRSLFRINNDGDGVLVIDRAELRSRAFRFIGSASATIEAGGSHEFDVEFVPAAGGRFDDELILSTNDSDERTFRFNITGLGLASEILVNGRGIASQYGPILDGDNSPRPEDGTDFRSTGVGFDEEYQFRIDNTGNKVLRITDARFIGDDQGEWSWRQLFPLVGARNIQPGESHQFWIRFTPQDVGLEQVVFELRNDDPNEDPYTFALRAEGVGTPQIRVRGLTALGVPFDISNGDLTPDQDVTQFGNVGPFQNETRNFRVVNDGTDDLLISAFSSSNPRFRISGLASRIAPGETDDFTVTFNPTEIEDDQRTTISITDNAGDPPAPPYTFALTGNGDGPLIQIFGGTGFATEINDGDNSASEAEGTIFPGRDPAAGSVTNTFLIRNAGTRALNIRGGSEVRGAAASSFDISNLFAGNPLVQIPAGGSQEFDVTFDPTTTGALDAVVDLETNIEGGARERFTFAVRGVGLDPDAIPNIEVLGLTSRLIRSGDTSPSNQDGTDFGLLPQASGSLTRSFQIRNTSVQSTLNLSAVSLLPGNVGFSVTQPGDLDLDPEGGTTFDVTFDPSLVTNGGRRTAIISITSDDPDTPTYAFTIQAEVEEPQIDSPPAISSTSLDGNDLVVVIDGPAGVTFKITTSETLQGPWITVPGQSGLSAGMIRLSDVLGQVDSSPHRFYRVEQE